MNAIQQYRERQEALDRRIEEVYHKALVEAARRKSWGLSSEEEAALCKRVEREVTEAVEIERARSLAPKVAPLRPGLERLDVSALTDYVEVIAEHHDTAVIWRRSSQFADGFAAFAVWQRREIHVPLIERGHEYRFATCLHEQGHICSGACSGPGHYVDERTSTAHRCIACETEAWRVALCKLSPAATLDLVHEQLCAALRRYRDTTPAPAAAFRALEKLCETATLDVVKEKKQGLAYYERLVRQWKAEANMAIVAKRR